MMKGTSGITALISIIVMTSGLAWSQPTPVQPAGHGTSGSPYLIDSLANLYWITQSDTAWGRYYQQTSDIDASGSVNWAGGKGFTPIGNGTTAFTGTYDGDGHTISNIALDMTGVYDYAAPFGHVYGGTVENLGLINVNVTGGTDNVAGLCAEVNNTGSVITNCYVTGTVSGSATTYVGGLIGQIALNAVVSNCYSNCTVLGNSSVGGLVGENYSATITDCYSTGAVTGSSNVGGLVGDESYATTNSSYWDTGTSGQSSSPGGGTGLTTSQMKKSANFTSWDFTSTWTITPGVNNGYPYLLAIRPYPADNYSAKFNGSTAYVLVQDNNSLDLTGSYTIEAWIKPASFSPLAGIVSKYQTNGSNGYILRLSGSSPYTGIGFDGMETSNGILTANTWYHIAAVNSNGTRTLYVNGIAVSLSGTAITVQANNDPIRIGCDYASRFFDGLIDEVRIWSVARTQAEIRGDMNTALTGAETGLVSYWNFNEGVDSAADPVSGNTATFFGGATWSLLTPVAGKGSSNTQTVSSTGPISFSGTDFDANFTSIAGTDTFVVSKVNAYPAGTQPTGVVTLAPMYWVLNQFGGGSISAAMTFTIASGAISSGDQSTPANLVLFNRGSNSDTVWTEIATAASATSSSVTFDGITDVGQFAIGTGGDSPLPVEGVQFTAMTSGRAIRLEWKTFVEVNNAGFEIFRQQLQTTNQAPRTTNWQLISSYTSNNSLRGLGTSSSGRVYDFTDNQVVSGATYKYKIESVSSSGVTKELSTLTVTVDVPKTYALYQNFPNPFNPSTTIRFDLNQQSDVALDIYNVLGERVLEANYGMLNAGRFNEVVNMERFASGVYFYRIVANGNDGQKFVSIKKLVLLK